MDERKAGAILGYVQIVLQSVIGIIYVPLLLKKIGQSEYGLYQIVASVISYVAILETMFSATVLRNYSVYLANQDIKRMENLLFTARRIFRMLSVLILAVSVPAGAGIYIFYRDTFVTSELYEMLAMYSILILNLLISVNNYIYLACITAHQKFLFLKTVSIASSILQPAAVIAVICVYPYAAVIVAVQVVLNVVVSLLRFFYCRKKLGVVVRQHKDVKDGLLKELALFSMGIFLAAIADQIFWKTDQIILGRTHGTTAVAIYAVGAQLFNMYMSLANGIGGVLLPTVIQKVNTEGISAVDVFFRKIGRIQAIIMVLLVSGFMVLGKDFIELWVGPGYETAYWVALCLMIPYLIDILQGTGLAILQALNQYSFRAKCMFIVASINVVLTVIMVQKIGIIGAAISTAIAIFVGPGLIMNWFYWKKIGLDIKRFWKEVAPILLFGIVFCFLSTIIRNHLHTCGWIGFIFNAVLFTVCYVISAYYTVLNPFERSQLIAIARRIIKKADLHEKSKG